MLDAVYTLPKGFTWTKVSEQRKLWGDIPKGHVPLAVAPGVVAWGRFIWKGENNASV